MDQTVVSRTGALALLLVFVLTLFGVPAVQTIEEWRTQRLSGQPLSAPQWCDAGNLPAEAMAVFRAESGGIRLSLFATNLFLQKELRLYEKGLEDASVLGQRLMPPVQWALLSLGGVGNEQAFIGSDGWLFYRPDIEFVTGRGFLDPRVQRKRLLSAKAWETPPEPDPLGAIIEFRDRLARGGINLLLVPVPAKPILEPRRFSLAAGAGEIDNPDTQALFSHLAEAGVDVIDVHAVLAAFRGSLDQPLYLRTDTHWRPEAMQAVAARIAAHLQDKGWLSGGRQEEFAGQTVAITGTGDIAAMLKLPDGYTPFPPETVTARRVSGPRNEPWRPDRSAEVMLLGDSMTNIYSLPSLGWGAQAGLAEQLSLTLQAPVDRLVRNDESAYATRQMFLGEWKADPERIAPKRVVIWQFAMRELAFGDWKRSPRPGF